MRRQETFPGWHRAYLKAFEEALQEADRALGNDGLIALPYWDAYTQPEVGGEVVPAIVRSWFPNGTETVRAMLHNPSTAPPGGKIQGKRREELWAKGYQIASDASIKDQFAAVNSAAARASHSVA